MQTAIAMGANLDSSIGSPQVTLERALELLERRGVDIRNMSRWYTSPAWPAGSGPNYTNGAAEITYSGSPRALLSILQEIEHELGRVRSSDEAERWSARVCDLDLIFHGAMVSPGLVAWRAAQAEEPEAAASELLLPHPRMHNRAFVLVPMADILPDWRHPILDQTVTELLAALPNADRVQVIPTLTQ